jgi:hypothetical protein
MKNSEILRAKGWYTLGILGLSLLQRTSAWGCTTCRPLVKAGVYDENFSANLLVLLLPLGVLALVVAALNFLVDARLSGTIEKAPLDVVQQSQMPEGV